MEGLKRLIQNEPVLLMGLVQSAIAMLTAFGLGWTAEQVALVLAFTQTLLSVIARSMVTPVVKAEAQAKDAAADARARAIVEQAMSPAPTDAELQAELDRIERDVQRRRGR